ncbi:NAD(+)/NADH kinase [Halopseudomonas pachastrellae]|nr:NAD(+)/NADH kinase [Halopseudomonas pachastrellae]
MHQQGVDLLLFAGGDGTARNICNQLDSTQLVLGIPAGVKIHSGVYAVNPRAAGELVALLVQGELVRLREADVRTTPLWRAGRAGRGPLCAAGQTGRP